MSCVLTTAISRISALLTVILFWCVVLVLCQGGVSSMGSGADNTVASVHSLSIGLGEVIGPVLGGMMLENLPRSPVRSNGLLLSSLCSDVSHRVVRPPHGVECACRRETLRICLTVPCSAINGTVFCTICCRRTLDESHDYHTVPYG